ncbi:response regulator [Mycobacterium sp.]|jgi:CheY-like chemotaxis protein|uniref:response regulator n=1 Tax=Mycobacterium sp. TaxID=1785 RepID=UPI002D5601DB|nr:response regulator [Mycobacterium sp.]HZA08861.1 response regulator [Mycobacterium sp.]
MRAAVGVADTGLVLVNERLRCVIVDDNADFLDAAVRLLECQGISVVAVARSTSDAVHDVEALQPDVTLVDINLGEEDGFDLIEQLHRNLPTAAAAAILISTHAEQDVAELVKTSSAVAYLPKSALCGSAIREILALVG